MTKRDIEDLNRFVDRQIRDLEDRDPDGLQRAKARIGYNG
jgi:hypothetical protein